MSPTCAASRSCVTSTVRCCASTRRTRRSCSARTAAQRKQRASRPRRPARRHAEQGVRCARRLRRVRRPSARAAAVARSPRRLLDGAAAARHRRGARGAQCRNACRPRAAVAQRRRVRRGNGLHAHEPDRPHHRWRVLGGPRGERPFAARGLSRAGDPPAHRASRQPDSAALSAAHDGGRARPGARARCYGFHEQKHPWTALIYLAAQALAVERAAFRV